MKAYEDNEFSPIQNIFFITSLCKEFGTLPFAGIARSAFITTALLRDLVKNDCINETDLSNFYGSINTITNKFNNDLYKLKRKKINKSTFLKKYGHLRPSTYSITSQNYKDGFDGYFHNIKNIKLNKIRTFELTQPKERLINKLLIQKYYLNMQN